MHFANGALGMLTVSVATHDAATRFDIVGEDAGLHLPWRITARDERVRRQLVAEARARRPGSRLARSSGGRPCPQQAATGLAAPGPPAAAPLHLHYWEAIADALDAGEPLPIGPIEARRSVELVTAIYTSAIEDRTVSLPLGPDAAYVGGVTAADYAGRARSPRWRS